MLGKSDWGTYLGINHDHYGINIKNFTTKTELQPAEVKADPKKMSEVMKNFFYENGTLKTEVTLTGLSTMTRKGGDHKIKIQEKGFNHESQNGTSTISYVDKKLKKYSVRLRGATVTENGNEITITNLTEATFYEAYEQEQQQYILFDRLATKSVPTYLHDKESQHLYLNQDPWMIRLKFKTMSLAGWTLDLIRAPIQMVCLVLKIATFANFWLPKLAVDKEKGNALTYTWENYSFKERAYDTYHDIARLILFIPLTLVKISLPLIAVLKTKPPTWGQPNKDGISEKTMSDEDKTTIFGYAKLYGEIDRFLYHRNLYAPCMQPNMKQDYQRVQVPIYNMPLCDLFDIPLSIIAGGKVAYIIKDPGANKDIVIL